MPNYNAPASVDAPSFVRQPTPGQYVYEENNEVYILTEDGWINLQGKTGPTGEDGVAGEVGPAGPKGDTGPVAIEVYAQPAQPSSDSPMGSLWIDTDAPDPAPIGGGSSETLLIAETFSGDLAAYIPNFGTSKTGLSLATGELASTDALDHSFYLPTDIIDAKHIVKIISSGSHTVFLAKWVSDTTMLFLQDNTVAGYIQFYSQLNNSYTLLGTMNRPTGTYWLVLRHVNNVAIGEVWQADPRFGGTPYGSYTYVLTGALATAHGAGKTGKPSLRLVGPNGSGTTTTKLDDWVVVPLVPPVNLGGF